MSIEMMIYLANVLPNLGKLLGVLGILLIALLVGVCLVWMANGDDPPVKRWYFAAVAALFVLATIIPSERTIYMMAGASIGKDLIASETGVKVQKLLNSKLDELISKGEKK